MKILYVGDIMGPVGLEVIDHLLDSVRRENGVDLVVAQAENASDGRGTSLADFVRLRKAGVDFCTGGNWSLYNSEIIQAMNDPAQPIVRPANYLAGTPGLGWKYVTSSKGVVLVVSLLGKVVGRDSAKDIDNPLLIIDQILESQRDVKKVAIIVNFHGDYSSEKVVIGHYLDGRVTAVIGDHWHVPTADARILPSGTAHITDVGMVGTLDSSLGVSFDTIVERWRSSKQSRNVLETKGPRQFNAVLITSNAHGLADDIQQIQITTEAR